MKKYLLMTFLILLVGAGCAQKKGGTDNIPPNTSSDTNPAQEQSADNESAGELPESLDISTNTNAEVSASAAGEEALPEEKDPTIGMTEQDKKAAEGRDKQRLEHVKQMQEALKKFFAEKSSYPENLEELAPKYIKEIPKNPTPGGEEYSYTPIGSLPSDYYDLVYTLEVGVDGQTYGQQVANPE